MDNQRNRADDHLQQFHRLVHESRIRSTQPTTASASPAKEGPVSNLTVTGNFLLNGTTSIQAINGGGPGGVQQHFDHQQLPWLRSVLRLLSRLDQRRNGNRQRDLRLQELRLFDQRLGGLSGGRVADADPPHLDQRLHRQRRLVKRPDYALRRQAATLLGGGHESNFVGGFGTQYIWSGPGANIFTYLSPADSTPSSAWTASATSIRPRTSSISATWTRTSFRRGAELHLHRHVGAPPARARRSDISGNGRRIKRSSQATLAGDTTPDCSIGSPAS